MLNTNYVYRQNQSNRNVEIDWDPTEFAAFLFYMEPFATFDYIDGEIAGPEYFGSPGFAVLHRGHGGWISTTDDNDDPSTGDQFFMLFDVRDGVDNCSCVKLGFGQVPAETNFTEVTFTRPDNMQSDAIVARTWMTFHWVRPSAFSCRNAYTILRVPELVQAYENADLRHKNIGGPYGLCSL